MGNRNIWSKPPMCQVAKFLFTNPTWPGLRSNLIRRGRKPPTNGLSYCMTRTYLITCCYCWCGGIIPEWLSLLWLALTVSFPYIIFLFCFFRCYLVLQLSNLHEFSFWVGWQGLKGLLKCPPVWRACNTDHTQPLQCSSNFLIFSLLRST
jgi:hypothetical protein